MALKKCKSCGNEVSGSSRRCPRCGAYLWTGGRIGFAIVAIIFAFLFFSRFASYDRKSTEYETSSNKSALLNMVDGMAAKTSSLSTTTSSAFKSYTFNGYTLNDRERAVFDATLVDDFYGYMDGKETLYSPKIFAINALNVTSDRLQSDYERNEVAGDQKYKDKTLLISGVISSINRSIGETIIFVYGGSNMYDGAARENGGWICKLSCKSSKR